MGGEYSIYSRILDVGLQVSKMTLYIMLAINMLLQQGDSQPGDMVHVEEANRQCYGSVTAWRYGTPGLGVLCTKSVKLTTSQTRVPCNIAVHVLCMHLADRRYVMLASTHKCYMARQV